MKSPISLLLLCHPNHMARVEYLSTHVPGLRIIYHKKFPLYTSLSVRCKHDLFMPLLKQLYPNSPISSGAPHFSLLVWVRSTEDDHRKATASASLIYQYQSALKSTTSTYSYIHFNGLNSPVSIELLMTLRTLVSRGL